MVVQAEIRGIQIYAHATHQLAKLSPYSFPAMSRVMAAAGGSFETFLSETKRTNRLLNTTTTPPAHHGVNLAKT